MKNKTYRFAAALAVLLALALVFAVPVGAEDVEVSTISDLKDKLVAGNSVKLTEDITVSFSGYNITIPNGVESTLDLNGHKITATDTSSSGNSGFLQVKGKLTITDTSSSKNGEITLSATIDKEWYALSAVVSVEGGELVVNAGTLGHTGGTDMAYAIDVNSTLGDTKLTVNNGSLKSNYIAVRLYANSKTGVSNVIVNGGSISGEKRGIWIHQPTANSQAQQYYLVINDGDISANQQGAVHVTVASTEGTAKLEINGGTLSSTSSSAVNYVPLSDSGLTDLSNHEVIINEAATMSSAPGMENFAQDSAFTTPTVPTVIPLPVQPTTSSSSSGKPTPGAYYNYPRTTENGGLVEFGTSKVVKSVTLPAGSSGKVNLHIDSIDYWPLAVDSEFTFDISVENLGAGTSYISFKIAESKLTALDITAADVGVYHNVDGDWVKLTVTYKIEEGDVVYTAETDSFSPFKLVVEAGAATPAVDEVIQDEPVVDEPVTPDVEQDVPGEDLPEIPDVQDEPEEPSSPAPVLGLLAALGAAVVLRRK